MNYTCASCKVQDCIKDEARRTHMPKNCPMRDEEFMAGVQGAYDDPEINRFYIQAGLTAIEGKEQKLPRVMEILSLCKRMGYHHIGVACCIGWVREADIVARIFRREGFEVDTVMCCAGGLNELEVGVPLDEKYYDGPDFSVGCNPIGQAKLLEKAGTEFNIMLGLCVGHDALFLKHSHVLCSVLTVKERCFAHNPVAGLYYAYGCMAPNGGKDDKK